MHSAHTDAPSQFAHAQWKFMKRQPTNKFISVIRKSAKNEISNLSNISTNAMNLRWREIYGGERENQEKKTAREARNY